MSKMICDFCSGSPVAWECRAEDFDHTVSFPHQLSDGRVGLLREGSMGSWLACDECVALVRGGDGEGLAKRAIDTFMAKHVEGRGLSQTVVNRTRAELGREIRRLHSLFWAHKDGQPIPLSDEKREEYGAMPDEVYEEHLS